MALCALSRHYKHHVFPSFHGEDVRRGLLSYLLKEFKGKGIDVFVDNDIQRSKSIGPELIEAIRGSKIAIVLISRNYASSTWCLNELVEIVKCRDADNQTVMVVFHEVEPSDVKKQTGYFGSVFEKTCAGKTSEEVSRWRQALQEVAKIAGYNSLKCDNDVVMIETIATDVSNQLNDSSTTSNDFEGLVGVGKHIMKINYLLSLESDDVRMVGIWGPTGIGKTTIARALYRKLSKKFTHTAFIESMKGKFEQDYQDDYDFMLHLQEQLLSKALNQKDLKIGHLGVAKERLRYKKVLVVLDDVDELKQLEAMANNTCWFGPGSRIIITTKDKQILKSHEINHIYQVGFPSASEALEILCLSAFRQKSPLLGFEYMAKEVTLLAGNLPLGLYVFGACLRGMSKQEWISALPRLRTSLDGGIEDVLRLSYDALCDQDQDLFLHIACFFKYERDSVVVECLAESRLNVIHGLQVLVDRCFISRLENGRLVVHNLLVILSKEIVRRRSISDPGKDQFLVDAQEICDVLKDNAGTKSIRGIDLDLSKIRKECDIDERAFEGMSRLQFLRITDSRYGSNSDRLFVPRRMKFRASKLRFLQWDHYPLTCLPRKFHPHHLVELKMMHSKLKKLWEGPIPLPCLKKMDVSFSNFLKKIPNLSNATSLEVLSASCCGSLEELHSSIGKATSLYVLNLSCCTNLMAIPSSIGNATNLNTLNLQMCQSLVQLPSSVGSLKGLKELLVTGCIRLKRFPEMSTTIEHLKLRCTLIEDFPSFMSFSCLRTLKIRKCKSLKVFPDVPDIIEELELSETGIEEVPSWIQNLTRLTKLSMDGCTELEILPTNVNLEALSSLDLSFCTKLKLFPEISTSIEYLDLRNTAIEEVPSSMWSWSHLVELNLGNCKSLQELDLSKTEENFSEGGLEETLPHVPLRINLNWCKSLVSLPHLPEFISFLDATGCESLERVDGFFANQELYLNFSNCLNLSQETKELISRSKSALLPGGELPPYYDHRAREDYVTINLENKPLPSLLRFKACLLLLHGSYIDDKVDHSIGDTKMLCCRILGVQNGGGLIEYGSCKYHLPALIGFTEHLYFLESSIPLNFIETCSELRFEFTITGLYWDIKECGVQLLEDPIAHDDNGCCENTCMEEEGEEAFTNIHNFRVPNVDPEAVYKGEFQRDTRRELGACVLVAVLCVGILAYTRQEKYLSLILPLLIYVIDIYQ